MRILHLTNKPIFPLLDGGCVAMNQVSKLLHAQGHSVKNLSIATTKHPFDLSKFPEDFIKKNNPEAVKLDTEIRISKASISLLKGTSYNLERFKSVQFSQRLAALLNEEKYEIVVCESVYLLPYYSIIRTNSSAKIIVRTHNVEYRIWERLTENARFPKSNYLSSLAKRLKREEIALLQQTDAILSISEKDTEVFKTLKIQTPIFTLPVFIDTVTQFVNARSNQFHHIGSMNWQPNLEAVELLLKSIFPKIKNQLPQAELHLAGSFFPENIKSDSSKGIFVHGYVDNAFDFIQNHGIQLIPLKSGSGVRIKILESMAIGTPIVTTKMGIEGIELDSEQALFIAKDEQEFVDCAVELSKNDELRAKMGANARQFITNNYNFDKINIQFSEFLEHVS